MPLQNSFFSTLQNSLRVKNELKIRPWVGWLLMIFLIVFSLDEMGLQVGDLRPIFWGIGLLITGSIYAINELHVLRLQGQELQAQLLQQGASLKTAIVSAHEASVERDMAEDALHESQLRYYHLAEATFEAICIHDGGTILDVNKNLGTLFGYEAEELVGKDILELCAIEVREEIRGTLKQNGTDSYETTALHKSGRHFPIEVSVKQMPYNGRDVRVTAIRDLSARNAAEAEREDSRKQMLFSEGSRKAILETSIDGILVFGEDDLIVDANPAAEQTFGWVRDEFIGRKVEDTVIAPSHRENYRRMLKESKQGGRGFLGKRVKVRAMRWDGSEFDSEVTTTAVCNKDSIDFVATIRDISERMQQQHKVESLLARMRSLIENLQAGVVVLDDEQKVVTANQVFCEAFGIGAGPEELVGTDGSSLAAQMGKVLADGAVFTAEFTKVMAARQALPVSEFDAIDGRVLERLYVPATQNGAFQGHVWIYRDVSRRKAAEGELEAARDAALDSARFKSQFLANMSHEIRTPMNAIVGMTDLLLDTPLNEEQKDFAGTVKQASESLLTLINQILDFSKIEAGKLTLEQEDLDLRELVEGVAGMFAARAQAKGIELAVDIAADVPLLLRGDSGRLGQVLVNLLGNSIKFTEKGDVVLSVSSSGGAGEMADLKIEVRDSGIGIAQDALKHLFQPFVQADGSITRRFGGTGLGLAISKDLVELMGGEIGVESSTTAPSGTTFWFKLALERQAGFRQKSSQVAPAVLAEMKVLVVDDNATNCLIVSHQLNGWKVSHGAADSGEAALEVLKQSNKDGAPFDVVLLDLQMPDMDGLSLAQAIKETSEIPTPRMILMSSLGHSPARETLTESGIQACLNKPVKQSSLLKALQGLGAPEQLFAAGSAKKAASLSAGGRREARKAKVLVAEDNQVNQSVIRSQLAKLGVDAKIVSNGREALEAIASEEFGLVLMDCQMPVLDGLAATREIREGEAGRSRRRLPVVALTANALEGDERRCLEAGMDDYLTKPLRFEHLERVLERWIPSSRAASLLEKDTHDALPVFSDAEVIKSMGEGWREEGIFAEMLQIFSSDTPPRLDRLEASVKALDYTAVRAEAHAIKGSCRALGALRMGASCEAMEKIGSEGKGNGLEKLMQDLKEEFHFTLEELAVMAASSAAVA